MRFALVDVEGTAAVGLLHTDGKLYDLSRLRTEEEGTFPPLRSTLDAALAREAIQNAFAERAAMGDVSDLLLPESAMLLAPLPRPNRVFAIGRNYAEHAKEQGATVTEDPIVFLKASSCVIGPDAPITIPEGIGRVDYEAELLVVLGKGGKHVSEEEAMHLVAGYTLFNDVTARAMQKKAQENRHPWFLAKSLDTFGPMGPYLVTPDEVPDPHALPITLTVNGETKQDDTTGSMVFRIPTLIAYLSRWFALEPGDVIATGTPSGISAIVPGDSVSITIPGLGTLTNPVAAGK